MRKIVYLLAFIGFGLVHAGSYEDFFRAVKRDDPGTVQSLLSRGFDANTLDPRGLHALFIAVQEPSPKVADVMMRWPKTNVEFRNSKDESPLMIAALKGELELARKLVERGADVNKTGWTPLHYAATNAHLDVMTMLLDNYAYIDAESPNKTTPLMMAAQYGNADAVKLLLEAGADPRLKNQLGLTAIDFATRAGRSDSAELIAGALRSQQPRGKW
ncbi:ankyrin repeat domain-containing protein [Caenimonas terrae]|uniref:Ankyrin repeat domain-containing protein n=1 Tax=Caenimonas terrae TaxID=696074 RepID=A0ABW0NL77_9BURK